MSDTVLQQVQAFLSAGKLAEAEAALQQAMRRERAPNPKLDHAMAVTLGRMSGPGSRERLVRAAFFAERAWEASGAGLQTGTATLGMTYGKLLAAIGDHPRAIPVFRRILDKRPDAPGAGHALAASLSATHQLTEAAAILTGLHAKTGGDDPIVAPALAATLLWMGEVEQAWNLIRQAADRQPDDPLIATSLANTACYVPGLSREEEWQAQRRYGAIFDRSVSITSPPITPRDPGRRPLKVGFLSPDFRAHSVASFLLPLLTALDPAEIRPYLYFTGTPDEETARFQKLACVFRDVAHLSDKDIAETVRAEEIDVLIDLSGHTRGHRLPVFLFRAAPVQLAYLGYPSITGLSQMDGRLVDAITDPVGEENTVTSERLIRLEAPFLCYEPPPMPEAVAKARAGPCPADKPFTFGSFNAASKLNPGVLAAWAEILRAAPASRLTLKATSFADAGVRDSTLRKFEALGVPRERVTILPPTASRQAHLAAYADIDLALDTFPYNGTTTTCEAAAMGIPTLTLQSDRHAGRVGATINHALGLGHLIAKTVPEYVATAIRTAEHRTAPASSSLRETLLKSPLCDARRLAASFASVVKAQALGTGH
ncbi:MAG: hypothetical protein HEQ23_10150 [Tepidisphaera sp.]